MNNTKISWTNKTWNPVTGYAADEEHGWVGDPLRFIQTLGMQRDVKAVGKRFLETSCHCLRVAVLASCGVLGAADLFHDDVPFEYIDRVMQTIRDCPQHTFQILTKRASRMYEYMQNFSYSHPSENGWCGVTVENIAGKARIECLRNIYNVPVRFLSCEPLIEDLGVLNLDRIDWVIVGGETGPKARPMKKDWVLNIQRQCKEQDVPFFFKSWGRYGENGRPCPKDQHDLLDGVKYQAYPKGWEKGETK